MNCCALSSYPTASTAYPPSTRSFDPGIGTTFLGAPFGAIEARVDGEAEDEGVALRQAAFHLARDRHDALVLDRLVVERGQFLQRRRQHRKIVVARIG